MRRCLFDTDTIHTQNVLVIVLVENYSLLLQRTVHPAVSIAKRLCTTRPSTADLHVAGLQAWNDHPIEDRYILQVHIWNPALVPLVERFGGGSD
jgi:hypothetical protein